MTSIWVLTQPADESKQEIISADVITSVTASKSTVSARLSDTNELVYLVEWSTRFDKRDPLPCACGTRSG
ncbi:hypothetical protein [Streptomyces werraensis]|uniref:hypothetical protein n=1 Tax=Streptomyces werraensis TaxID=68284 RepID=UPI0033A15A14